MSPFTLQCAGISPSNLSLPECTFERFASGLLGGRKIQAFSSLEVVKGKALKYEQGHANERVHEALIAARLPIAPYNAQAIIEGTSFDDLQAVFTNEEYRTVISGEASKYFERDTLIFAFNVATLADLHV